MPSIGRVVWFPWLLVKFWSPPYLSSWWCM